MWGLELDATVGGPKPRTGRASMRLPRRSASPDVGPLKRWVVGFTSRPGAYTPASVRRIGSTFLLLLILTLSACGGSSSTSPIEAPQGRSDAQSHAGANEPMVIPARGASPEIEPRRLEFLALEGKPFALAEISWRSWGKVPAVGEAELQESGDCYPNCARIEYHDRAPVHVRLAQLDSKCGRRLYRRIIVIPEPTKSASSSPSTALSSWRSHIPARRPSDGSAGGKGPTGR